jgi:hypothetical protein
MKRIHSASLMGELITLPISYKNDQYQRAGAVFTTLHFLRKLRMWQIS